MQKIKLSIVIVHYGDPGLMYECIQSIYDQNIKFLYEIVVVDNNLVDISTTIKKYKYVKYIHNNKNVGYSKGNNIGVYNARGEYVLILNPDTVLMPRSIHLMVRFLDANQLVAVVTPMLLNQNLSPFLQIGMRELGVIQGIVCLSFLNKLLPFNAISKNYYCRDMDLNDDNRIEVFPGSVFMIRKNVFESVKGFDEEFFLYFEEVDLAKRLVNDGWQLYYLAKAKCIHKWASLTPKHLNTKKIYRSSRYHYFSKHYGHFLAVLVEAFARFSPKKFVFVLAAVIIFLLVI